MADEHQEAVDNLAKKVTDMLPDPADARIADNAIKIGAMYLPTKEIEQYEAAVTSAREAVRVLHKVGGPITGVAAGDTIHSSPVFNPAHATAWDKREGFKDRSEDS